MTTIDVYGLPHLDQSALAELVSVGKATVGEIERIIGELETIRDLLRAEGDRVQREFAKYVSGSQAMTAAVQLVAEKLTGHAHS
jgi:predicted ATP-dependent protease